jgi:hypothetical protein
MNWLQRTILATATWALVGFGASAAFAQGGGPANLQYTPPPPLSPYLNLFSNTGPGSAYASQLYVRPQLEQYAYNNQAASAINGLQQQLNQVRSSSGFGTTGNAQQLRPTGHASTYLDYGHYYIFGRR